VLLTLELVTLVAMLNRHRSFPKLFTWLWLAAVFLPIVDMFVTVSLFPQLGSQLFGAEFFRTGWWRSCAACGSGTCWSRCA